MNTRPTIYKIAIVGDGGVGKSSLLEAKKTQTFDSERGLTIGVDFDFIPLEKMNNTEKNKQFLAMDLGGQERFHFIHEAYLKGIKGAIIMFDISRYKTFVHLKHWIELIHNENNEIPLIVVGNKIDLSPDGEKEKFITEIEKLMEDPCTKGCVFGYTFTSAKTTENVSETFHMCEEMIMNSIE